MKTGLLRTEAGYIISTETEPCAGTNCQETSEIGDSTEERKGEHRHSTLSDFAAEEEAGS